MMGPINAPAFRLAASPICATRARRRSRGAIALAFTDAPSPIAASVMRAWPSSPSARTRELYADTDMGTDMESETGPVFEHAADGFANMVQRTRPARDVRYSLAPPSHALPLLVARMAASAAVVDGARVREGATANAPGGGVEGASVVAFDMKDKMGLFFSVCSLLVSVQLLLPRVL